MSTAEQHEDADVPVPRRTPVTGSHVVVAEAIPTERLLGVVAVACAAQLLASWGLQQLIARELGSAVALLLVVGLSAGIALGLTALVRQRGFEQVISTAPVAFVLVPPIASVVLGLPWFLLTGAGNLEAALLRVVPLLAATTASGLAIASTLEQTLWALAARISEDAARARQAEGAEDSGESSRRRPPPSLAGRLARLVATLALATFMLVLTYAMVHGPSPDAWLLRPRTWLACLGATVCVVTAIIAAVSAGMSPGRDVQALARRLDAIGWDEGSQASASGAVRPLASPVRVTSFDAVGELFASLERLRARLADDVSTYQRALDRTHAADEAKREFLAAVSHELRTPLNSILGYAQLLLESELNESQAEDVRLILAGGQQLQELIEDILDLSMIESGELELRFASCELDRVVEDIVDIHRAQVRERGVELRCDIHRPVPAIVCDRKRIGQVVTNLLSNAIKFTEEGSVTVSLSYDPRREQVSVAIADTGVGIAAEELEAIFEEYRQVGARKRKIRGTGLGLAIARRIAEAHGGRLMARSKLEVGSTFTLRLPLKPPESPDPGASP